MAITSMRSGKKRNAARPTGATKKPEDIRRIQNQVRNVILNGSVKMAERIVRSVHEEGSIGALKVLWETASLFPSGDAGVAATAEEPLAKALIEALELPTKEAEQDEESEDEADGDADVESEETEGDRVTG